MGNNAGVVQKQRCYALCEVQSNENAEFIGIEIRSRIRIYAESVEEPAYKKINAQTNHINGHSRSEVILDC